MIEVIDFRFGCMPRKDKRQQKSGEVHTESNSGFEYLLYL